VEDLKCEKCGKDCEELITRQGFRTTFYCEFVCAECFEVLEAELLKDTVEVESE